MPRRAMLDTLSFSQIQAALKKKQGRIRELQANKRRLEKELSKIEAAIAAETGTKTRSGRSRNSMSLNEAIHTYLEKAGSPKSVGEILEGVESLGYRSSSPNFRGILNQTLIKDKRFKSTSRGVYTLA